MRRIALLLSACMLLLGVTVPAGAATLPDVIELPDGFFPEGIAIGSGTTFYTGSLVDGAIYRGDLRSGQGEVIAEGSEGGLAVGMDFDHSTGTLYVANGSQARVTAYDGRTGDVVDVATVAGGFVNDLIVSGDYVFATDSFVAQYYAIHLEEDGSFGDVVTIPLSGDFQLEPGQFNSNGIEATASGSALVIVNSFFGEIYLVNPLTGVASVVDLGGAIVNGDGLVLAGNTLYAVVGGENAVYEIALTPRTHSGTVVDIITDEDFDVPTTAAIGGGSLYAVNAKFSTPPGPDVPYEIVRVDR